MFGFLLLFSVLQEYYRHNIILHGVCVPYGQRMATQSPFHLQIRHFIKKIFGGGGGGIPWHPPALILLDVARLALP